MGEKVKKSCANCEHAKFDELWGEYKCVLHGHRCNLIELYTGCPEWKEKKDERANS